MSSPSIDEIERERWASTLDRVATRLDSLERRGIRIAVPAAAIKSLVLTPALPPLWIAMGVTSRRYNTLSRRRARTIAAELSPPPLTGQRLAGAGETLRADARGKYFITSDLHRGPAGGRDWSNSNGAAAVYAAALHHYADNGWGLIENGDVEDFWVVGGSNWGVAYDLVRMVGSAFGRSGRNARLAAYRLHLDRTVANHGPTYRAITERFLSRSSYFRVRGNHDDSYEQPDLVDRLRDHLPGTPIADSVLLCADHRLVGFVAHGHRTDPWNGPVGRWRGRVITWFASLLADMPGIDELGPPSEAQVLAPFRAKGVNVLTALDRWLGLDPKRHSLDETVLHDAFDERFGAHSAPWLVCGHTHDPMIRPIDPQTRTVFSRYANSGSGICPGVITGVEWDGSTYDGSDPGSVTVRLVGYTVGHPEPGVGTAIGMVGDRPLVRTELAPVDDNGRLAPTAADA